MLKLENINKCLGSFSLINIDFTVSKGDYFILIGESGAGKSVILEIISGLIHPDSGNIMLDEKNITNTEPQKRNFGIVFQKPSLFPHMTVFENIAYPLKIRKYSGDIIRSRVEKLAADTEISHLLKRKIDNLSGGEVQRVSIARTLATKPDILLLDEPLSFLDVQLKKGLLSLLRKLNRNGQTIIHVTHDYEEALALTNKIAIIENGNIIQSGNSAEIFNSPKSAFVANFIGINNFFKAVLLMSDAGNGLKMIAISGVKIYLSSTVAINSHGFIFIPDNAITISEEENNSITINNFQAEIKDIYQTKNGREILIDIGFELIAKIPDFTLNNMDLSIGNKLCICIAPELILFINN